MLPPSALGPSRPAVPASAARSAEPWMVSEGASLIPRFVAHRGGAADEGVDRAGSPSPTRRGIRGGYPSEFGPLAALVAEPAVTDVFVNGNSGVWFDRGNGIERAAGIEFDEGTLRQLAVRLLSLGGRHIDESTPCVDARLQDGIRVHAVLPPVAPEGTLLSIRLPRIDRISLDDLSGAGFFAPGHRLLIDRFVSERRNLLITGAGGSGKTTLLAAMLQAAHPGERIVAIEDVAELRVDHPQFVALEARQANIEGAGEIGLERLVREALRMRPDRLVLGECRGREIRDLLSALNTGHNGGAGTLHANSLDDVPARLEALGALADLSDTAIARQATSAIGAILHLEQAGGVRRLAAVGRLAIGKRGRLFVKPWPADSTAVDSTAADSDAAQSTAAQSSATHPARADALRAAYCP